MIIGLQYENFLDKYYDYFTEFCAFLDSRLELIQVCALEDFLFLDN